MSTVGEVEHAQNVFGLFGVKVAFPVGPVDWVEVVW